MQKLGYQVIGRDLLPDFINYRIAQQIEIIKQDINEFLAGGGSILVARSYGAFILLQTLIEMNPFTGMVLLLSPVLGASKVEAGGTVFFKPPRSYKLLDMARAGIFPIPQYLELHAGTEDKQCHSSIADEFSRLLPGIKLTLVKGAGHTLDQGYVEDALKKFLLGRLDDPDDEIFTLR